MTTAGYSHTTVDPAGAQRPAPQDEAKKIVHYVNEDWRPLCGAPPGNAWLWAFDDGRITCPACRRLLHEDRDPK